MGIIFQDFQLLADHTVRENLDFVLRATGWKRKAERRQRIDEVLNLVELPEKIDKYPHELSGGEQQRISIARALLNTPRIILADEPTGALDTASGKQIMDIFRSLSDGGMTIIMITHEQAIAECADKIYRILDGCLITGEKEAKADGEE